MAYGIKLFRLDITPSCPKSSKLHTFQNSSKLHSGGPALCIFWVWFKTLVGNIAAFCIYQLPRRLVAVSSVSFSSLASQQKQVCLLVIPTRLETLHTDQTLWRHYRPLSLTALTVQLLEVLRFFGFQIINTTPETQWIPDLCKFKVCNFCSVLLRSPLVWIPYFHTSITITKRKKNIGVNFSIPHKKIKRMITKYLVCVRVRTYVIF